MNAPLLQLKNISKSFGGEPALRGARLEVAVGEIHGLVGENGAGKSTLINIATGVLQPDSGEILLGGAPASITGPRDAARRGIAVVHQEADLFAQLSLAENMLLGQGLVRGPGGLINWPATYREAERMVADVGERFDVRAEAGGLSVARRMMAGIAAAVSAEARLLFLDEPTASLTAREIDHLFEQLHRLRAAGTAIIYVSHRLDEVMALCGRVTVLRDGETVSTRPVAELTLDAIVGAMVGRERTRMYTKEPATPGDVRLEVRGATARGLAFRDVSLDARAGEIVGLYGFVGAGRSELAQALFGLRKLAAGQLRLDGRPVRIRSPRHAVRLGLSYLPEDRLVQGVFRNHPLRTNASVATLRQLAILSWIPSSREHTLADKVVSDMAVRASSIEQPIASLSGGNQQKVVFGRWQATGPKVLLLDEPTRGVDVGAKSEIHKLISDMARNGAAIVLISSELPEIMAMSDRIVTLSEGRLTGVFDPKKDPEHAVAAAAVPRSAGGPAEVRRVERGWTARLTQVREVGLLGFIAVLAGLMALWKPGEFANLSNIFDVLTFAALPAIMALGVMLIICAGGIDISIGSMMGLTGALAAMAARGGWPPGVCFALALALGGALSMLNGTTALLARIHPIIVTLAGLSIYRGAMLAITGGNEVMNLPAGYRAFADGAWLGMPKVVFYVFGATLLVHVFLRYTLWGRQVLALGNSASASRLIGLSRWKLTLLVFAISGALVGLASVLHAGFYGKVQSNTGTGMELQAIAAAVIGGANILGGRGSAIGAMLGAVLVALVYNILTLAQISTYWQHSFVGALILAAVVLDVGLQRYRERPA